MPDLSGPLAVTFTAASLIAALLLLQEAVRLSWRAGQSGLRHGETLIGKGRRIFAGLKPVVWASTKWPRLSAFAAARFRLGTFSGLPLTLIFVALVYAVMLIAGLVEELFEGNELLALDTAIFEFIRPVRTEPVLTVLGAITHFADAPTIIAVALVVTAMLWAHGPQRFILPFWVSVLGAQLTTTFGKYVLDRSRPQFADIVPENPSFPSGHSASAVSTYLLLAYILVRDMPAGNRKILTVYWLAATAGLIALSRMVLGVHYASDVLAGLLVGGFWVLVAIAIAELLKQKPARSTTERQEISEPRSGRFSHE